MLCVVLLRILCLLVLDLMLLCVMICFVCVTLQVVASCVWWFVLRACFVGLLNVIVPAGFVLFSLIAVVVTPRRVCCLLMLVCWYVVAWRFVLSGFAWFCC